MMARRYPAPLELALTAAPKMGLAHAWNRGFPNNKRLRQLKEEHQS